MSDTDLFEHRREQLTRDGAPLADRMRPRSLEEFVGQDHIVGPGRLLRRAIEADRLSSVIFYGPPGTGKTTLARVIANTTAAHFTTLNAVLSGVKDIREAVAAAKERLGMHGRRTILFVDEVHRFNKAQQDALLPWVENGTVVLIGATTENPYFEVNKALVSRSRVFQLRPLESEDLERVAVMALEDRERGFGELRVEIAPDAMAHLVNVADGDARALLNALELAVETTAPDSEGRVAVDLSVAEESIQRRAVLYDKEGDVHYDTISAFIKSLRGGDPDAALYWLARMIYAGEDPRFVFRRMLILASEDVGLADPSAVDVVAACAAAFDYVGLPEGQFHLAQAALYLALAPKSNSTLAYFEALSSVERERASDVPSHLRDANRDREAFGHGEGYRYPHAFRDHWVAQQYLPDSLRSRVFYRPSRQGFEAELSARTARRREAQLAAAVEGAQDEVLTFTGRVAGKARERWLARATGEAGARLGEIRDRIMDLADPPRHARVLDLRAGTGLLTWEALRRAPEGGVWAVAEDAESAAALESLAKDLDPVDRPVIVPGDGQRLVPEGLPPLDLIVGRNAVLRRTAVARATREVLDALAENGRAVLAESLPGLGPYPSDILELPEDLRQAVKQIEADWSEDLPDSADIESLAATLRSEGATSSVTRLTLPGKLTLDPAVIDRWFADDAPYRTALGEALSDDQLEEVRAAADSLVGRQVDWPLHVGMVKASSR